MKQGTKKNSVAAKKVRVLIADDSRAIRDTLASSCSLLARLEVVGQAKDGLEAIEAIRELKPDVITLDIRMPKMSGIEVLKAIRAARFDCVVIVLSAISEEIYRQKCTELGAKYVFDKAAGLEQVMRLLQTLPVP